jgi:hypothetical protein
MVMSFSPESLTRKVFSSLRSKQMPYSAKTCASSARCTANLEPTLCSSPVSATTVVPAEFKTADCSANCDLAIVTYLMITYLSADIRVGSIEVSVAADI